MIRENCNERLVKYIETVLEGERATTKESVQFAWEYLQYLVAKDKVDKVLKELLGGIL